jgi:hypothetical protein
MIDLKRFAKIKQQAEEAKSEADRARGALEQLMARLKKEFGCTTLKQAKRLLRKKIEERDYAEALFNEALRAFESEYKDALK